jgi:hypothetical protein
VVPARIAALQFMGPFIRLRLVLAGGPARAVECDVPATAVADTGLKEGAEVPLALRAESLRVFPPEA